MTAAPMAWLELIIDMDQLDPERLEQALFAHGALAVSFEDAGEAPLLEPEPGVVTLWPATRVSALFSRSANLTRVRQGLCRALELVALPSNRTEVLEDKAWEEEWRKSFPLRCFGDRLWVCPSGSAPPGFPTAVVHLDPGLAFGTGAHPTTEACLEWLAHAELTGRRVLDFGCGSGILALAALALGARRVTAVDHDPQALIATAANAEANRAARRLAVCPPSQLAATAYDVTLANILARPLMALAPLLAELTRTGGHTVLAGLLTEQAPEVGRRYAAWFDMDSPVVHEGWALLTGRRLGT